mmetsp:Transcript_16778/g.39330  ORF Transcript_16778/g.39330 Transcript_16778/m.39330 type:complete len:204 (-) Transcript_16778:132-743(-)
MVRRLFVRAAEAYRNSRRAVQTASEVIEEHKSLLWLLGTGSSALAGWAVYTARRLHYQRIEGEMSQIVSEMKAMKKQEEAVIAPQAPAAGNSTLRLMLVLVPAVASAFLFGYIVGRTTTSFHWHKQVKINKGLAERRVYVAVVPERLFEANIVANELEKAVARADKELVGATSWLSHFKGSVSKEPMAHDRVAEDKGPKLSTM